MTLELGLILAITVVMFVAAWLSAQAFDNFRHLTLRCIPVGFVIAALSWGGFSVALQTFIPEADELRELALRLGLFTKLTSGIVLCVGMYGMWRYTNRYK